MTVRFFLLFSITLLTLVRCDFKSQREVALELEADSLREELYVTSKMTEVLLEVGSILDSIDVSRDLLDTKNTDGPPHREYVSRLENIHLQIQNSNSKIDSLETKLAESRSATDKNLEVIKHLKEQLLASQSEVVKLTQQITTILDENAELMNKIARQGADLNDKSVSLIKSQNEAAQLQADIQKIMNKSKTDLADGYFKQAQALEEAAKRTKLAPRKKKNTLKEALELYNLAYANGKMEAKEKIDELTKSL